MKPHKATFQLLIALLLYCLTPAVWAFDMCVDTSSIASSGDLNDSGGTGANYQNNQDCQFLISPTGATSVTLNFSAFNLENNFDFLRVYDGNNTAAPLLGSFSGTTVPGTVTSSGGELLLRFTSDFSVTSNGFIAAWTMNGGGGGGSCDTFGDNFDTVSYANQDGSVNWSGNWVESNDNGSPNNGDILIEGSRLRIKDDSRAISRTADLSAYSSATLSFDYQESGYDNNNDSTDVQVRGGGNGWQTLQSFAGSAVNSGSASITIPVQFIASDFELRFITSASTGNNDNFRVDNLVLEGCGGGAAICSVADNFNNVAYNQNDGADNWSGDWLEVAEVDGPSAGIARVRNDNCTAGNCLRLGVPSGGGAQTYNGIGVRREVDLSGVGLAELTFNYRTGFGGGTASVDLWVSDDGGSSWNLLQTYNITATSFTATAQTFDISAYASSNSQIRFTANGTSATTGFYVDDVAITYPCVKFPVAEWRLDELSWSGGGALDVLDSSGNGLNATAVNGVTTDGTSPAIAGDPGTCRYGMFDGLNDYIDLSGMPDLTGSFSISAWIYANETGNDQRIFVDDENDTNGFAFSLGDGGNGRLRFFSRNINPVIVDTQSAVISPNQWYHVVAIHNAAAKTRQIFVNGTAVPLSTGGLSSTYTGTWGFDNGVASIGGETNNAGSEAVPNWRFNGNIDEVRVYNDALSIAEVTTVMNETRPCPVTGPDHYQITHSGQGITCEAEPITVTAHDVSDVAVSPSSSTTITLSTSIANDGWSLQTGGGNGTFTPPNQYTFDGIETSATFLLSKVTPVTGMDIDVTDGSVTDQDGNTTEDAEINFVDSGLRFYADGNNNTIGTQIAGKSSGIAPGDQTLTLRAVETDTNTGACVARITGTQTIQMGFECINPTSCKTSNGVTIADLNGASGGTLADNPQGIPISSFNSVELEFDLNGEATWTMNYQDAGEIKLHASHLLPASAPDPEVTLIGTSNAFVSVPAGLCVSSSDTNAACSTPYADCDPAFRKAGEGFNLDIRAVAWESAGETNTDFCSGNSTTPNFQLDAINITQNLVAPSLGAIGVTGVTSFNMVSGDDGDHNINNQTVSEVGVFSYTAGPLTYLGETIAVSTSAEIGRFIPDHFAITNLVNGVLNASCSSNFTYIGQEFGYLIAPSFIIEAQNTSNAPTLNYQGADWAKILSSGVYVVNTVTEDETQVGTDLITKLAIYHALPTNRINIDGDNGNGTFNASFGADVFCYGADDSITNGGCTKLAQSQIAAFDSAIKLTVSSIGDGDVTTTFTQDFTPASSQQRFGRLSMDNVFGSELIGLTMPMYTEVFDGNNFVLNNGTLPLIGGDSCSVVNTVDLDILPSLTGGTSNVTVISPTASVGILDINLTAPGAGNTGSIQVGHQPTTVDSWLKYDWDGGGSYDDDPSATATFGIYEGNDVNIYIQQTYQ